MLIASCHQYHPRLRPLSRNRDRSEEEHVPYHMIVNGGQKEKLLSHLVFAVNALVTNSPYVLYKSRTIVSYVQHTH